MRGYERLNQREADLLWDGWKERPEEELDSFFDRLSLSVELPKGDIDPCDLYDVCGECPNFQDCFGLSVPQVSRQVVIYIPE